jgi:hypothetical protein
LWPITTIELLRIMRPTAKRRNVALETFETRYSEDQSSGKEERRPDQTETRCAPKGAEEPDEGSAGQPLHGVATIENDARAEKAYPHDNLSDDATRVSLGAS